MKKKAFTTNLYLGLQLEAKTEDLMAGQVAVWHLECLPDADAAYVCNQAVKKG